MSGHKKHQSNFSFHLMSLEFRFRDWLRPPIKILRESGVKSGMKILDFGCGPGGFSVAAARLTGDEGAVYAVDINPFALKYVRKNADKQSLKHLHVIHLDEISAISDESIDMILLYDVLHDIPAPEALLHDFSRILKKTGSLSVSDHHMNKESLLSIIPAGGLFFFTGSSQWTLEFKKNSTGDSMP